MNILDLEVPIEKQQRNEINLPKINGEGSNDQGLAVNLPKSEKESVLKYLHMLTSSKSDPQLDLQPVGWNDLSATWHNIAAFSEDVFSESIHSVKGVWSGSISRGMSFDDIQLLSTKSGMRALLQFLKGKAGEKNWLFWLDAERVKYYKGSEQQRYMW